MSTTSEENDKTELRPYEIGRFIFLPNHKIHCLYIRIKPKYLHVPGVLKEILEILSKRNISIVHFKMPRPYENQPIEFLIFVDLTNINKDTINTIIKELKEMEYAEQVECIEPVIDGLSAYNKLFPLTMFNKRVVIFRKPVYEALLKKLPQKWGWGVRAFLYYLGKEVGTNVYKDLKNIIRQIHPTKEDKSLLIKISEVLFTQVGFGMIEIINIDYKNHKATVRVYHSFECELFQKEDKPASHLIRGIIAGWLSAFFNKNVDCEETKCIAKGDPYCEFITVKSN